MRKLFLTIAFFSLTIAHAQLEDDKNQFNHLSIGVSAGTTGIGVEVGTVISPIIGLRAGVDWMPPFVVSNKVNFKKPANFTDFPSVLLENRYGYNFEDPIDIKGKLNMLNGKVLFDFFTSRESMFHFTVGAYFGSPNFIHAKGDKVIRTAVERYNNDVINGNINTEEPFDPSNPEPSLVHMEFENYRVHRNTTNGLGEMDARSWAVKPYIGIGVGRTIPRKQIGCKFEFGVLFWGSPKLIDTYGNDGKGYEVKPNDPGIDGKGISDDFSKGLDIARKVIVYPQLKVTLNGRIF